MNIHGSWMIGLAVVFAFLASGLFEIQWGSIEARRWTRSERMKLETALLLSLVAIPITPYGTRLAAYPFNMASTLPVNVGNIQEWQPMPFNIVGGKLFLAIVLGFFVAQMMMQLRLRSRSMRFFRRVRRWPVCMCGFCCCLFRSARRSWRR